MNRNTAILTSLVIALASSTASQALAVDEYNTGPGLTYAGAPLGMRGVDPVAFVELGNRIPGSAKYTAKFDGVAYYLSSAENLAKFNTAPRKYTPQYGGFCAFGASVGKKFDGDPRYSAVEHGKLYFFLNEDILRAYQKDRTKTIINANKTWPKIRSIAATDL